MVMVSSVKIRVRVLQLELVHWYWKNRIGRFPVLQWTGRMDTGCPYCTVYTQPSAKLTGK